MKINFYSLIAIVIILCVFSCKTPEPKEKTLQELAIDATNVLEKTANDGIVDSIEILELKKVFDEFEKQNYSKFRLLIEFNKEENKEISTNFENAIMVVAECQGAEKAMEIIQ